MSGFRKKNKLMKIIMDIYIYESRAIIDVKF